MKAYSVDVIWRGRTTITVEACSAEDAEEIAMEKITYELDGDEEIVDACAVAVSK